jgi:hypothetical protein
MYYAPTAIPGTIGLSCGKIMVTLGIDNAKVFVLESLASDVR